jgi:predicted amidohydrolase
VLPELAFTGYYFRDREETVRLAEDPNDSQTIASLVALCREREFHLVTGFAERSKDKVFNSALLIGPDRIEHVIESFIYSTRRKTVLICAFFSAGLG